MDVKKFQEMRNDEMSTFKENYGFLKTQYSSALASAIREPDPQNQQNLIQQVQQANAKLTELLHGIIGDINKHTDKFDAKELDALTADLIQYQHDYAEIEKSKDKMATLKIIGAKTKENLASATNMYYFYVFALVMLCFYVGYLVLQTSWAKSAVSTITQALPTQLQAPLA